MILDFGYVCSELTLRIERMDNPACLASHTVVSPGGRALNQAMAAARMGAKVSLIGAIGDDIIGKDIITKLHREGIATTGVSKSRLPTGILTRIRSDDGQKLDILAAGANVMLKSLQIPLMALHHKALLLLQDDVSVGENLALLRRAKDNGAITVMNLRQNAQMSEIKAYADFLVVGKDIDVPDDVKGDVVQYVSSDEHDFDAPFA